MAGPDSSEDDDPEPAGEQAEAGETSQSEQQEAGDTSAGSDESGGDEPPEIAPDEQASVPSALDDIDPDDVEAEAGAGSDDGDDETADERDDDAAESGAQSDTSVGAMQPSTGGDSPVKAGEMYVSLVQSVTNAQVSAYGGSNAEELDRAHFEQYDLAAHFDATMEEMGVGSDLDPHEALLLATVLSVGDGLVSETDVLDQQINRLMAKAMGNGGASA